MKSRGILILILISINYFLSFGQILHTESFAVILDTTRVVKGNIVPDFKFQNLKKDLIEFENTTDISFKIKESAITIANKIELSKYGEEVLLSGGFLYVEYRKFFENRFVIEPFSQIHWSEARGLEFKYAGGINLRYRIYYKDNIGFYAGTGPFYEYEKWNFDGVQDNLVPANPGDVVTENIKLGTYLSFKWKTNFDLDFDFSLYHQSTFNELVNSPRLASSSSLKYNFTEHLGLIFQYQNIYDYNPTVPIDKLYNQFLASIEVSF
jgi:hypothetical protein